jgi:serine/threonine protein phosphatase PrpC
MLRIDAVAFTHPGVTRPLNQDTIAVDGWIRSAPMTRPARHHLPLDRPRLLLVADGMGHGAAGAIASRAAAEALVHLVKRADDPDAVVKMVETAHAVLRALIRQRPALAGMATTVAGLVLTPERVMVFNVGDSRVHRIGPGTIEQLSTDDAPGPRRPDGRTAMIKSSLVTQVVGGGTRPLTLQPHVLDLPLQAGTSYLASSDGLTDLVRPEAIADAIDDHHTDAVERLFQLAMEAGGTDNISLLLARLTTDAEPVATRKRGLEAGARQVRTNPPGQRASRAEIVEVRQEIARLDRAIRAGFAETRTAIASIDPSHRTLPTAWRAEVRSAEARLEAAIRRARRATVRWIAGTFVLQLLIMAGLLAFLLWLSTIGGSEAWLSSMVGGSESGLVRP